MAPDTDGELLVGRYRKLAAIGVGGMARVYLAHDELLGRRVAIKLLHADSPDDAALRFQREAKLGASLNHPNLVSIFDIAADDEAVLIVMEYVEGETLHDAIARGPVPPERAIAVLRDTAAGLDHAHRHGIVHRDVKPANILVRRDGMAKLADLGIATAAERTAITQSGVVLGTASYMAPEQLAGDRAGPRSDVYALAAVAFETLSGHKARAGKTPVEVAHEVVSGPPPDLADEWRDAPPAAAAVLARGMAREPEARPASGGALVRDLERALRIGERPLEPTARMAASTAARPVGWALPPGPSRRHTAARTWATRAAVLVLAAALATAGVVALGDGGDDDGGRRQQAAEQQSDRQQRSDAQREGGGGRPASGAADREAETPSAEPAEPSPAPAPTTTDPVALNDEGYALMQAGDYAAAIPLLERAVAAFPEDSRELTYGYALYNLGRSLRLAGRPAEAVPILERRLRIPNQTETVERELDAARSAAG